MWLSCLQFLPLVVMVSGGATQDLQDSQCLPSFQQEVNIFGVDSTSKEIKLQGNVGLAEYLGLLDKPMSTIGCEQTLLFTATTPEEVAAFVERGFDPNHVSDIGTPLEVARALGRIDIVGALLNNGAKLDRPSISDETTVVDITIDGVSRKRR